MPAEEARIAYAALQQVAELAQTDPVLSCARPLLLFEQHGIVVTEWLEGPTLARRIQFGTARQSAHLVRGAGEWLALLYRGIGLSEQPLPASAMLEQLENAIPPGNGIRTHPPLRRALDLLHETLTQVDGELVLWSQKHGDFKPGNLILANGRLAAVDVGLREDGPCGVDAAYFLNHVTARLALRPGREAASKRAEAAFLDGFSGAGLWLAPVPSTWLRLHHGLRVMLGYRSWSRRHFAVVAGVTGSWLVKRLSNQLAASHDAQVGVRVAQAQPSVANRKNPDMVFSARPIDGTPKNV